MSETPTYETPEEAQEAMETLKAAVVSQYPQLEPLLSVTAYRNPHNERVYGWVGIMTRPLGSVSVGECIFTFESMPKFVALTQIARVIAAPELGRDFLRLAQNAFIRTYERVEQDEFNAL